MYHGTSMNLLRLFLSSIVKTVGRENLSLIPSPSGGGAYLRHILGVVGRPQGPFQHPTKSESLALLSYLLFFSLLQCLLSMQMWKNLGSTWFPCFFECVWFCLWNLLLKYTYLLSEMLFSVFCCDNPPFRCWRSSSELSHEEFHWVKFWVENALI